MKKIPEGYKETELGVIPQEWEVKKLGDLFQIKHGYAFKSEYFSDNETKYFLVTPGNVKLGGGFNINKGRFYSEDGELNPEYFLQSDDLIVTMTDLNKNGGTLGLPAIIPQNNHYVFLHNQRIGKIIDFNFLKVDRKYIYFLMCTNRYVKQIFSTATGTTVNHTSPTKILNYEAEIPPLPEQQKIAEILSSVDDHIEKLDETISEYELLKKGMMKKLLTEGIGHTEFKDTEIGRIPKEWEVKRIEDIAITASGGTPSRAKEEYYMNGSIPWIKTGELKQKYIYKAEEFITEEAVKNSSAKLVEKDSIILAMYGATIGNLSITKITCTTNQACCCIKTKDNIDTEYLYYFLLNDKENIISKGAGGAQPNISQKIVKNHLVSVPLLSEQHQIASILSLIDERIELYKSEKEDFVQVKKGLMEKLLTGKIRV